MNVYNVAKLFEPIIPENYQPISITDVRGVAKKQNEKINMVMQTVKTELIGQNQTQALKYLHELIQFEEKECKGTISWVRSSEKAFHRPLTQEIETLRSLKKELRKLDAEIVSQEKIMENREQLYGNPELPSSSSFQQILKDLVSKHPELKEDCEHLKHVLMCHMRTNPGSEVSIGITSADVIQLRNFQKKIPVLEKELAALVQHEIAQIEKAYTHKKDLLIDLAHSFKFISKSFEDWSKKEKIEFYTKVQQVLFNPLEIPIDAMEFVDDITPFGLDEESSKLRQLCNFIKIQHKIEKNKKPNEFWDYVPLFEKKAHDLAATPEEKSFLYECKMEGLQSILKKVEKVSDDQETLLIGGGPGGLIRALSLTFAGHKYRLIEKRESEKQNRENVITLGKVIPKDLSILLFFGVLSKLEMEQKPSFGHLRPKLLEVKISDLETEFKRTLENLGQSKNLDFGKEVIKIKNMDGQTEVIVQNVKDKTQEILKPSLIIAADGASSPARTMLGISRIQVAKTTEIAYSIFRKAPEPTAFETLKSRVHNFLRGLALGVSMIVHKLFLNTTAEEAYAREMKRGPTVLFRIPEHDYLISCLREKEQKEVDTFKEKIERCTYKIEKLKKKMSKEGEDTPENQQKLEKFTKNLNMAKEKLENFLTKESENMHGFVDYLCHVMSKNHDFQKMELKRNYLVDIVIGKAETSFVKVGNTPVILRGDSSHTTDPYSGFGCKTAIEETLADQFLFSFGRPGSIGELAESCQAWGHQFYQSSMINHGLRERSLYRANTELLTRYLALGMENDLLTKKEAFALQKMASKAQSTSSTFKIEFSEIEKTLLNDLQARFKSQLSSQWKVGKLDVKTIDASWEHPLSRQERSILEKTINFLLESPDRIDNNLIKKMEPVLGKMAYEGTKEAPLLSLLLQCLIISNEQN